MTYDYKQVLKYVLTGYKDWARSIGFRGPDKFRMFTDKNTFTSRSIHISVSAYPGEGCQFSVSVGRKILLLDNFLKPTRENWTDDNERSWAPIGGQLGNIAGVGYTSWDCTDNSHAQTAVDGMIEETVRVGFPYLEKYANPRAILEFYRLEDWDAPEKHPDHFSFPNFQVAFSLAYLLGDAILFGEMKEEFIAWFAKPGNQNPKYVEFFEYVLKQEKSEGLLNRFKEIGYPYL